MHTACSGTCRLARNNCSFYGRFHVPAIRIVHGTVERFSRAVTDKVASYLSNGEMKWKERFKLIAEQRPIQLHRNVCTANRNIEETKLKIRRLKRNVVTSGLAIESTKVDTVVAPGRA